MGGVFHDTLGYDPSIVHPPVMGGGFFQPQGAGSGGRSAPYLPSTSQFLGRQGTGGGPWISESRSISTINGLTTSVHECVDSSGNKHTTTTHPDGHKTYAINGASDQIEPPHHHRRHRRRHHHSRGRHDGHGPYRAYDRDYSPNRRDPRRPDF